MYQGHLEKAVTYFERAEQQSQMMVHGDLLPDMITQFYLGMTLAYRGDFHRAIGNLDCNWRLAEQSGHHTLATLLRATLGLLLVLIKRNREAAFHLDSALKAAVADQNAFAIRIAYFGTARQSLQAGDAKKAHEAFIQAFMPVKGQQLSKEFAAPWVLEMLYEFERLGLTPIPGLAYHQILKKIERENNIYLKGSALMLLAKEKRQQGLDASEILPDLEESREYLETAGAPVELSKTLTELVRLAIAQGNHGEARQQALSAWRILGGYAEYFFPDDLRHLVDPVRNIPSVESSRQDFLQRCLNLIGTVLPARNKEQIYNRVVVATNRFFGAERGGLFWFPKGKYTKSPELRAGSNFSANDMMSEAFRPNLALVLRAFRENRPILVRKGGLDTGKCGIQAKAVFCLPIEEDGLVRGVLYHDNAYLEDCFDFLDSPSINMLVDHFNKLVARVRGYCRMKEERQTLISQVSLAERKDRENPLIFQSGIMEKLLQQADSCAQSDSTILILGDTGVGKELLARRIHAMSPRSEKTFMALDATTIPDGLFESELFGHEKGSFTGADRQKKGRIELADQ
ncbi:MAG: sigma 54-interacting transcriptional regulator, partial [Deltaproteobacteria bacterium]|nr:sigma 54-interacting transcriptional regulator [Deltaproteobacteria bacterium]